MIYLSWKRVAKFSWFFVDRVLLITLLGIKNFGTVKPPNVKYLEIHLFFKNFDTPFWKFYLHKLAGGIIFFKKYFLKDLELFFTNAKPITWASNFAHKKYYYTCFQVRLFHFKMISITCFKNRFRIIEKKWWFDSLT